MDYKEFCETVVNWYLDVTGEATLYKLPLSSDLKTLYELLFPEDKKDESTPTS